MFICKMYNNPNVSLIFKYLFLSIFEKQTIKWYDYPTEIPNYRNIF